MSAQGIDERMINVYYYYYYLTVSGWKYKTAKERLPELKTAQVKKGKDNCMGEHLDPRVPFKTAIIKKNLHLLHANVVNKEIFPPRTIISADRKRQNLAQMYKPTVSQRYVQHGPKNRPGFYSLQRKMRHVSPFKRNHCSCISVGR